jgi:hypothetical protein
MKRRRESGGGTVVGDNTFCGRTTIISLFENSLPVPVRLYDEAKLERKQNVGK